ncbi:MAG: tRNA 2-thiocytidine biosynthesis protein TtcA [Ruminiclostridium sp.]|nr:tRNA 2-thiocytidine biosynthesis protein TtcA [Ruminiclostridium sp.]MBQ8842010.1 tRNA 2-thiocytidine biosynthesis protein TtcA [Ruminiclostridium sp.]
MQKMLGYVRKACQEFDMIQDGDRIAVGVSGGKDSLVLLNALAGYRRFSPQKFDIVAITLDPQFGGVQTDYSPVKKMCEDLGIEYDLILTDIGQIVFDIRKEPNPCSLCAKLRRGALHDAALKHGCNKIALGHHNDDVIETFIMNLFREGRVGCFAPVTYLSRKDITMIRPMVFAPEQAVVSCCNRNGFEVVKSKCPADHTTVRQETKDWLMEMERKDKGFKIRIFGALRRSGVNGWGFKVNEEDKTEE